MDVSVVIIDWHQPELTRRALASVLSQRVDGSVEVVLVVNEADDATVARYRADHPDVVVVAEPTNTGFAGGVVRGIAASSGEVVVLVNNDAVADHGFLDRGLAVLAAAGPRVAAVAATAVLEGRFVPIDPATARSADDLVAADGRRWRRAETGQTLVNGTGVVLDRSGNGRDRDWLRPLDDAPEPAPLFGFSGGAVFLRRGPLTEVGGFDPSLFMYYEDLDVAWRLRLAGYEIRHAPDAVVVHRHAASSGSDSPLVRSQSMRNRLAVVLRNASAGFALRVVVRTAGRLVRDLLRPASAQLTPAAWWRLCREAPAVLRHARRARRADGFDAAARRRVEAALAPDV
ncbi:glycosyltransferase family 2 protein [Curtobacterium sp. MCSS17_015]|uniref:glycosyltransferase family 2 protein n=1 Tax=Curtobacterium sp. MCSS17_015 TaxID=2175666 RepID=UPI000DA6EA3D|nr:glycosyltransferase family 2 protein [Curtobacterium sp. MCSS17_015]WIB25328.1 glycosyltransferase family 2 protein [Curtobacterium sp. MCSS17_015]